MKYIKSEKYNSSFYREKIMGPNPVKLLEEILNKYPLKENSTVLDLGCGKGLTSAFMVNEYSVRVFAADLWISPTENKSFFDLLGLDVSRIIPLRAEAHALPFAEESFDTVVSIDSYHYFGLDDSYLGTHLLPLVKHGGLILIVVPGLKRDIHDNIPPEMLKSWTPEDIETLHDMEYWKAIFRKTESAKLLSAFEMEGYTECWQDWLATENEYAVHDRKAMEAGADKYMNLIGFALKRL